MANHFNSTAQPNRQHRERNQRRTALQLETMEPRVLLNATLPLLTSFEGIDFDQDTALTGAEHIPPDPSGAAGPDHFVNVVNDSIEWYTKAGEFQNQQSLLNFFSALSATNVFDPKVLYDQHNERFAVVVLDLQQNASRILLGISDDANPNGTWHLQAINSNVDIGGSLHFADYPGFAVDEEAIYITANLVPFDGEFTAGSHLWIVDKGLGSGGLYDGGAASVSDFDPSDEAGLSVTLFTLQPAHIFGTPQNATFGTFLVSSGPGAFGLSGEEVINIIKVVDPLGTPQFGSLFADVGDVDQGGDPFNFAGGVPNASQAGSSDLIETNDGRMLDAIWRAGGSLYVTNTVNPPSGPNAGQATAQVYHIDTSSFAMPGFHNVTQTIEIGGEDIAPGTHTFFPSLMVDAAGNLAVGYSASGPDTFAGAFYAGRRPDDPLGTIGPSQQLAGGQSVYELNDRARVRAAL